MFLTNFLPDVRARLHIDVEDIRKVNPQIIYVRGTALGVRGEDRSRPGFDGISYWYRSGSAFGATPPNLEGNRADAGTGLWGLHRRDDDRRRDLGRALRSGTDR